MMLTTSLPLLTPPTSSLLQFDQPNIETSNGQDGQHSLQAQQRRTRGHPHSMHSKSQLTALSYDERLLSQRKLAIQMYGYSWLKPAGCNKTMLGRREEELERDDAERQLREVEMQERNQAEAEEAERQAEQERQRARGEQGEDIGEGERDLDDEVPDMDAQDSLEEEDSDLDDDDDEDDDTNDIDDGDSGWAYETNQGVNANPGSQHTPSSGLQRSSRARLNSARRARQEELEEESAAQGLLQEDDMLGFDDERDLDDDIPDEDDELHNLDSDIPDADDGDGGWEHTDTELEESDIMDISIMPPGATAHLHQTQHPPSSSIAPRRRRHIPRESIASEASDISSGLRRTSGNVPLPMAPPPPPSSSRQGLTRTQRLPPHFTPDQMGSDFSVSALISTGGTAASSGPRNGNQQPWLDPATARRNLFGAVRNTVDQHSGSSRPNGLSQGSRSSRPPQVSSGGLFTPPTQQHDESELRSRTRSGRVIRGSRAGG